MTQPSPSSTIWDPRHECLDRPALEALQLERLRNMVAHLRKNVAFYRQRLDEAGVHEDNIQSLADVRRIPFTTKQDLRDHYPYGLLATPLSEVARLHASTGTTGNPTVVAYTRRDLETWAELVARFLYAAGVRSHDIAQIAFGYGLFTGGFGLHYGMERVGTAVIPISGGNTERQVRLMRDLRPTVLICTPSYSLHIAEVARAAGLGPDDLSLRIGCFGSEPWSEAMRREIEARLGLSATDNYGLSEVIGPGVAGECLEKHGMHFSEDHFIIEHLDPETGEPAAPGALGELVITPLTREAFSVLRYRTRDLCRLIDEPCSCGRTTRRMTKIVGRTDDMLIVRGVNLFPSQVEQVLLDMGGVEPHYQLIVSREGAMDCLEILVEVSPELFSDEMKEMRLREKELEKRLHSALGVSFKLSLVESRTLERGAGKAKRVVDKRKI
ncbi:MAG TPA: phenylacetate--CoA ligase [Candidatus Sumerlaeota bacterium]|nr:phenylacetate--CoA ligase [Candidatus Sumerlaeota bacterium]HPS00256.1 phenylacetate--CoA ligase [Candidatus Sumerlaeota bacterium]